MGTDFEILKEFSSWCERENIVRSYASNLKSVQKDLCDYLSKHKWVVNKTTGYECHVANFFNNLLLNPKKRYDFVEAVDALVKDGDYAYAISIVDAMCYAVAKFKKEIINANGGTTTINDKHSALKKFLEFLYFEKKGIFYLENNSKRDNNYKSSLDKGLLVKIDGIEALAETLGEDEFIRLAVENSYFFSRETVEDNMNEILANFINGTALPARKTIKTKVSGEDDYCHVSNDGGQMIFCDNNGLKTPIVLSKDGNDFVRTTIKKYTGFTVCEGADSIFQNYMISHIWGRAYDPRYFTGLWNIVLVPAWANSLLDKNGDEESLASKLKAVYMSISKNMYCFKKQNWWEKLHMPEPAICGKGKDVKYNVRILCRKENDAKSKIGSIKVEEISAKVKS